LADRNHLDKEQSPYLLQHASNPVNWYPWGEKAFKKAREEDKPVFLSIGYATCHWCHVMAHESFEDAEVAELMNDTFVSIKVDREERPDIDHTYMTACQIISGRGGWPLNVLLTPEKKPFYAATYIPRESRFGRPGMKEFIPRIKKLWEEQREKIHDSADEISEAIEKMGSMNPSDETLDETVLHRCFKELKNQYNEEHGGFGSAPKFPTPHHLLFLLRYWKRTGDDQAQNMVESTLDRMRRGGIYDHVGYGFHRYSTDEKWLVPHFEKMLYDQAMLALAYTEGYQVTHKPLFKRTVEEIFTYVIRDMQHEEGGFFSAEDADSEGEEGKFYIWEPQEIEDALDEDDAKMIIDIFNVEPNGNYHDEASGEKTGASILHMTDTHKQLGLRYDKETETLRDYIDNLRQKLYQYRNQRERPLRDDKILTDWNGLMIAALAKGGQVFNNNQYIDKAREAVNFILENMYEGQDHLMHRYRNGNIAVPGHADDYAFLIWGLIELYEATFELKYLQTALELQEEFDQHFWDNERGGYYFNADFDDELLGRQKPAYDSALPSGNSVAMNNLVRLGRLTARIEWENQAEDIGKLFFKQIEDTPSGFTQLLQAVDFELGPSFEVVLVGNLDSGDTKNLWNHLNRTYTPKKVVLFKPMEDASALEEIAPYTADMKARNQQATVYVCEDYQCNLPTTDAEEMVDLLEL